MCKEDCDDHEEYFQSAGTENDEENALEKNLELYEKRSKASKMKI